MLNVQWMTISACIGACDCSKSAQRLSQCRILCVSTGSSSEGYGLTKDEKVNKRRKAVTLKVVKIPSG